MVTTWSDMVKARDSWPWCFVNPQLRAGGEVGGCGGPGDKVQGITGRSAPHGDVRDERSDTTVTANDRYDWMMAEYVELAERNGNSYLIGGVYTP